MFACAVYLFYIPDEEMVNKFMFYVGVVCITLYLIIVPESPRWLFTHFGQNSQEAIGVINYIAWFNGSTRRVPSHAIFDSLGQMVEEN